MKEAIDVKKECLTKTKEEWDTIFQEQKDTINEAIDIYLELRRLFQNEYSFLFRWLFMSFYGMGGRLNKEKRERFFSHFKVDNESLLAVRDIVNDINDDKESSAYFSFVTKMLNMKDEALYPIYDSRIAIKAFGCDSKTEMDLNGKEECYKRIKKLYDSVENSDPALVLFKYYFPKADGLGKMRILDFILYNTL